MSPRSIGSQRYTNLLTKMRSWSWSEGIMLVPSTFTGWYRKMMMKPEIPSDKIKSLNQTMSNGNARDGAFAVGATVGTVGICSCMLIPIIRLGPQGQKFGKNLL